MYDIRSPKREIFSSQVDIVNNIHSLHGPTYVLYLYSFMSFSTEIQMIQHFNMFTQLYCKVISYKLRHLVVVK